MPDESGKAFINGCSQGLSSASLFRATRIAFYFHSTGRTDAIADIIILRSDDTGCFTSNLF